MNDYVKSFGEHCQLAGCPWRPSASPWRRGTASLARRVLVGLSRQPVLGPRARGGRDSSLRSVTPGCYPRVALVFEGALDPIRCTPRGWRIFSPHWPDRPKDPESRAVNFLMSPASRFLSASTTVRRRSPRARRLGGAPLAVIALLSRAWRDFCGGIEISRPVSRVDILWLVLRIISKP